MFEEAKTFNRPASFLKLFLHYEMLCIILIERPCKILVSFLFNFIFLDILVCLLSKDIVEPNVPCVLFYIVFVVFVYAYSFGVSFKFQLSFDFVAVCVELVPDCRINRKFAGLNAIPPNQFAFL